MSDALMVGGNRALLEQGMALLDGLRDEQYAAAGEPEPGGGGIGAQYRHLLEHYQAFLDGFAGGRVDYDSRPRDRTLETSRAEALAETRRCLAGLLALDGAPERSLQVRMDCDPDQPAAEWRASSAGRELQFLYSHTVHHFALIRLLLTAAPVALSRGFGVAASTQRHAAGKLGPD